MKTINSLKAHISFIVVRIMRWLTGKRGTADSKVSVPILCQRCKVLQLNDLAQGGTAAEGYSHVSFNKAKKLFLDYDLEDEFPALPTLSESATGCAFCALLRDALLETNDGMKSSKLIIYKAAYCLEEPKIWEEGPDRLDRLSIFYKLQPSEGEEKSHAIRFEIYADPQGKNSSLRL
jgi:hypothetical protein